LNGFIQLSERLENLENVIIDLIEKDPYEVFEKRMKGKFK